MLANLVWNAAGGFGDFGDPANWQHLDTGLVSDDPPAQGDSLTFDGRSDADCLGMYGFGADPMNPDYASFRLLSGYAGTVTLGTGVSTDVFTLRSGSIAQGGTYANLSVSSTFTWSGGVLNSTASDAVVAILGGGEITLGGDGTTLTAGSVLSFGGLNPAAVATTVITGGGTLLLNTTNGNAMFISADSKVKRVVGPVPGTIKTDFDTKTITIQKGGELGFVGAGAEELGFRLVNEGGKFFLGGPDSETDTSTVTLQITAADQGNVAYFQILSMGSEPQLRIMNGCKLDVGTRKVDVYGGQVFLVGNTGIAAVDQVATIKGTFRIYGGEIGFLTPTLIGTERVWGRFQVEGDVDWHGGTYIPGVNSGPEGARANQWIVTGTMDIRGQGANRPTINPVQQYLPPGPQPARTWEVILANTLGAKIVTADDPAVPAGWTLDPTVVNGVTRKLSVTK